MSRFRLSYFVGLWFLLPLGAFSASAPSQEFWDYMADFSDENGEVIDPLELDEVVVAKEQGTLELEPSAVANTTASVKSSKITAIHAQPEGQRSIKKVDSNMSSHSSASAVSHKGVAL